MALSNIQSLEARTREFIARAADDFVPEEHRRALREGPAPASAPAPAQPQVVVIQQHDSSDFWFWMYAFHSNPSSVHHHHYYDPLPPVAPRRRGRHFDSLSHVTSQEEGKKTGKKKNEGMSEGERAGIVIIGAVVLAVSVAAYSYLYEGTKTACAHLKQGQDLKKSWKEMPDPADFTDGVRETLNRVLDAQQTVDSIRKKRAIIYQVSCVVAGAAAVALIAAAIFNSPVLAGVAGVVAVATLVFAGTTALMSWIVDERKITRAQSGDYEKIARHFILTAQQPQAAQVPAPSTGDAPPPYTDADRKMWEQRQHDFAPTAPAA